MARGHAKLADRVDDPGHEFRGRRNAGGKLHRRGQKTRKFQETSPIVAEAIVVHVEKQETALEAKIVAGLARANAKIQAARATETDRHLAALVQAKWDVENIAHVPSAAKRNARIAEQIVAYC